MEETLFEFHPCHVFRLPPTGYLSSVLWEGGHIWSGKIRVVRKYSESGTALPTHTVHLLELGSDAVFAVCPLKDEAQHAGGSFQVANDSSRCFVLRVEQGDQHAYLGINFEEKADAFRFCTAVVERNKRLHLFAQPQEDAVTRYGGSHSNELRAEGKIEVDLHGKWAQPSSSGAVHSASSASGFSLDNIPRASSHSRRVGSSTQQQQQPPPPAAVAMKVAATPSASGGAQNVASSTNPLVSSATTQPSKATSQPTIDPFADFPTMHAVSSSVSSSQSAMVNTSTADPFASTAPSASSDPFASSQPQHQAPNHLAASSAPADPFAGLEIQQPQTAMRGALPTSTTGVATSNALDAFF
ncbi:Hypothetical protein, putative [Bodo saltans]|uniref:NECAP PHear domain-containing protein n=1 Tax=Bodo saltans TaxID=75058 RepID=A0A0S4JGB1_BODSA|nr:Hypothetical protein, putative [Bodo saltans]|eukprot:CUG90590.1 Hypothetical protein, putative [Bodo saltans]